MIALALALTLAMPTELTETERKLYLLGEEWKTRALQAEERAAMLDLKLRLTEESRQRWRTKYLEKPPVIVEVVPMWAAMLTGGALGAATGATVSLSVGADIGQASQAIMISSAAGVAVGWIVWFASSP